MSLGIMGNRLRTSMGIVNIGWIENTPDSLASTLGDTTGLAEKMYVRCCTHFWVGFPSYFNLQENRVVNIGKMKFCKINILKIIQLEKSLPIGVRGQFGLMKMDPLWMQENIKNKKVFWKIFEIRGPKNEIRKSIFENWNLKI